MKEKGEKILNEAIKGLKIYQRNDCFNYTLDSILLSNYVTINRKTKKILDIGTGNGIISMILAKKSKAKIEAIEIQKISSDLAKENIEINNLTEQINIINDDINNWSYYYEEGSFDSIVCNPPFFKNKDKNENLNKEIARHEKHLSLEKLLEISKILLKNNGYLTIVHRTERLVDIIELFRKNNIEPKRIKLVYTKKNKNSKIFLIEGIKNSKTGLVIEPAIITNDNEGLYTKEINDMYKI